MKGNIDVVDMSNEASADTILGSVSVACDLCERGFLIAWVNMFMLWLWSG